MKNKYLASPPNALKIVKQLSKEFGYRGLIDGYAAYKKASIRHDPTLNKTIPRDILSSWDRMCLDRNIISGYL